MSTIEGFGNFLNNPKTSTQFILNSLAKAKDKSLTSTDIFKSLGYDSYYYPKNDILNIFDSKNNLVSTVKTDKSGIAKVNNLVTGTYKILEKSTNKFYKLNTKEVEVKVDKGNTDITITNQEKKGYIEIDKYDKEQYEKSNKKIGLSGVKFGIFDIEGNKIQEIVTDVNRICKKFSTNFEKAICC